MYAGCHIISCLKLSVSVGIERRRTSTVVRHWFCSSCIATGAAWLNKRRSLSDIQPEIARMLHTRVLKHCNKAKKRRCGVMDGDLGLGIGSRLCFESCSSACSVHGAHCGKVESLKLLLRDTKKEHNKKVQDLLHTSCCAI